MTRRDMMRYGAAAGGAAIIATNGPLPRSFARESQSPSLDPFVEDLPVPPEPISTVIPFDHLPPDFDPFIDRTGRKGVARFYHLVAEERSIQFHRNLPPTSIWGYRDANVPNWNFVLGPTFKEDISPNRFSGAVVRLENRLSKNSQGFGEPRLTMHLHGGHQLARSDGFPENVGNISFKPVAEPDGGSFDYLYPLLDPGSISGQADSTERPSTLWYHDHLLDFTDPNVYRGLVGFFRVFDNPLAPNALDLDDETNPAGLRLPSGEFDVPIVIQDKILTDKGTLVFDPFNHDGILGDTYILNGKVQPRLKVSRRRYRLRFLNGSPARFYELFLTNSSGKPLPMAVIATEGGLLDHVLTPITNFSLAPAERIEVIVDFAGFKDGDQLFFENRLAQDDGRGPRGTFENPVIRPSGTRLIRFDVTGPEVKYDPSLKPFPNAPLRPFQPISQADLNKVTVFREFVFERRHGSWVVNDELAGDLSRSLAAPAIEKAEIWTLTNKSGGWWHPIHIHSEFHRVIRRDRGQPAELERDGVARKDTVVLGPNSQVDVYLKYRDYTGPFMMHCHNLAHEDAAMMARYDVQPVKGVPSF